MLKSLWLDEGGAILSAELVLIMVLLVIGMVVGLTALRDAVDYQLADIAGAIAAIDPSFAYTGLQYSGTGLGLTGGGAVVAGSAFQATFNVSTTGGALGMITVVTAGTTKGVTAP